MKAQFLHFESCTYHTTIRLRRPRRCKEAIDLGLHLFHDKKDYQGAINAFTLALVRL